MAYTRERFQACPVCADPAVLTVLLNHVAAASAADYTIKIPWNNARFVYGYTVVTTKVNSKATFNIDFEKTAAGGHLLATVAPAKSAAVGTVTEFTMTAAGASSTSYEEFVFDDGDAINLELTGASSATGQCLVYMYFEPGVY